MTPTNAPLAGIRVLQVDRGWMPAFAGMILADLGADVITLDHIQGTTFEQGGAPASLDRNKRSVMVDRDAADAQTRLRALASASDVVIVGSERRRADPGFSQMAGPLVWCSLSPFGERGDLKDAEATDLTVQALASAMDTTGEPDRDPVKMGPPVPSVLGALYAVAGILAALHRKEPTVLSVSAFDAMVSFISYMGPTYLETGAVPRRLGSGHHAIYPYNVFSTNDGYLVVAPFTQSFWRKFCAVIEMPELIEDPRFLKFADRMRNKADLSVILDARMAERSMADWHRDLDAGDVPHGPVNSIAETLAMEQTRLRDMVAPLLTPDGSAETVGTPFHFLFESDEPFRPTFHEAKRLSDEDVEQLVRDRAGITEPPTSGGRWARSQEPPLSGLRVADFTRILAGPHATLVLADLGAEVVKIEDTQGGDGTRHNPPIVQGESLYFQACNRGKKSVTLDLKTKEGLRIASRIIQESDIVVENFRPGVFERLGFTYDYLRELRPGIIVCSISGYGQAGPMSRKPSFDLVSQAVGGIMSTTGEPGRSPIRCGVALGDLGVGTFGVVAILAALRHRDETGEGASIDMSLHDCLVSMLTAQGHEVLNGVAQRTASGSRVPGVTISGAYRASDGWLAIEVCEQSQLDGLTEVLAASADEFPTPVDGGESEWAAGGSADRRLRDALALRPLDSLVSALRKAGVPASPVWRMDETLDSTQSVLSEMVVPVDHPVLGRIRTIGSPFKADGGVWFNSDAAPLHGHHTADVLRELAGVEADEMAELQSSGVLR